MVEPTMFEAELNRETVGQQVVQSLRNAIITGALGEGETLTESALSKQLGTSRSPIREAMQQLRREGLIVSGPNRTMVVVSLDAEDVEELYEYRLVLERFAIGKVCRMSPDDRGEVVTQLEKVLEEMRSAIAAGDDFAISTVDLAFHNTLIEAGRNRRLSQTYRGLSVEFKMLINRLETYRPSGEELIDDHRAFVDAIRDGDEVRAAALIEAHLHSAADNLRQSSVDAPVTN